MTTLHNAYNNGWALHMTERYQRQQSVPYFGAESATILAKAKVLIVGLGGLGCPAAQLLAGAGVGTLTLIDPDTVSLSNLHRQTLYREHDIGQTKVQVAQQQLNAYNPEVTVHAHAQALTANNVQKWVQEVDLVLDCSDRFITSYTLSDACLHYNVPLLSASVVSTSGYLGAFCGGKAPSLRALFPAPSATAANCNTAGVTGPSATIIGAYQAQEALKILLNDSNSLFGTLLRFNLWNYRQSSLRFDGATEPTDYAPILHVKDIQQDDCVLDVRSLVEHQQSPHAFATHPIPLDALANSHNNLPKNQRIVCVCHSGQRALHAAHFLLNQGHKNIAVASA